MRSMSKAALAALFGFALVASGCGSDDDDSADDVGVEASDGAEEASEDAAGVGAGADEEADGEATGGDAEGSVPAECPAVGSFEGTIERTADDEAGHRAVTLEGSDVTDAIASDFMGLYSIYLADHEVDRSVLDEVLEGTISSDSYVEAPADSVLVTIGMGDLYADAPTAAGDVLTAEGHSLTVTVDSGGGSRMIEPEGEGSAEVLGLTDGSICFTIEYQDGSLSLDGIVHAAVYDGTN